MDWVWKSTIDLFDFVECYVWISEYWSTKLDKQILLSVNLFVAVAQSRYTISVLSKASQEASLRGRGDWLGSEQGEVIWLGSEHSRFG